MQSIEIDHIFTVPALSSGNRNCSGNVLAIQYCYTAVNGSMIETNQSVFKLYYLTVENRKYFINSSFLVTTTSSRNCSSTYCCDSTTFSNQLHFPESNFTLGVKWIIGGYFRLASFTLFSEFNAEQYLLTDIEGSHTLPAVSLSHQPLLLLRFLLGIYNTNQPVLWNPLMWTH